MNRISIAAALVAIIFLCSFAAVTWVNLEQKEGNFKIAFPIKPSEAKEDVESELGVLKMNMFMAETDKLEAENAFYMLFYSDYPDSLVSSDKDKSIVDGLLRGASTGAAQNIKGTVTKEEDRPYKNYPGKHVLISFSEGQATMEGWVLLIRNRMYVMEVGYENGKSNKASIDKFFGSFQALTTK